MSPVKGSEAGIVDTKIIREEDCQDDRSHQHPCYLNMYIPTPGDVVPGKQEAGARRDQHLSDGGGDEADPDDPRRAAEACGGDQCEDEQGPVRRASSRRRPQ